METWAIVITGISIGAVAAALAVWRGAKKRTQPTQAMDIVRERISQLRTIDTLSNRQALADSLFDAGLYHGALDQYRECVDEFGTMSDAVLERIDEISLALEHLDEFAEVDSEPQQAIADIVELDTEKTAASSAFTPAQPNQGLLH